MTSSQLVFGSREAKHLIFGNSLLMLLKGEKEGRTFGDELQYGVLACSGATLAQLLNDVEATLAGLPEQDKAARICIVQVLL